MGRGYWHNVVSRGIMGRRQLTRAVVVTLHGKLSCKYRVDTRKIFIAPTGRPTVG